MVGFPDSAKHLEHRIGQRQDSFFISLTDDSQNHLLGVNRRNRQRNSLIDPQTIGVDERETAAIDRVFQSGNQVAAILVAPNVR